MTPVLHKHLSGPRPQRTSANLRLFRVSDAFLSYCFCIELMILKVDESGTCLWVQVLGAGWSWVLTWYYWHPLDKCSPWITNLGQALAPFFSSTGGNIQILVALLLESDSYETIELQRTLKSLGTDQSFIVRVVIVGLCRFSVWILVFLVLVSNCISVMRNSLQCQASAYQFLGLLLVSWIVINGTNKWDEDR